jgi:HD-like signal output (HDOD) protein
MLDFRSRFGGKAAQGQATASAPTADFRERFAGDLKKLDQIPSLPTVVTRLMAMINDPKVSTQDLARALREDPPLTARTLRMANSPIYGSGTRVLSVPDAVMRLGTLEVQNLIMAVGLIRSVFTGRTGFDYRAFWSHWFTVATATEALARMAGGASRDQDGGAFTVGLLHDIGRFVVAQVYPDASAAVLREAQARRIGLVAAETGVLGIDHAEIGGMLATQWGLPKPIVSGIAGHHHPDAADPECRLALLVYVAEKSCEASELGDPLEAESDGDLSASWEALGADPAQATAVAAAASAAAAKSATLLDTAK